MKEAVAKLMASLTPPDLVAFVSTRRNGVRTNLTFRREAITSALGSIVPGPGRLGTCQREMMAFLESFSQSVPRGRSTTIAVISRGNNRGASFAGDSESGPCAPRRDDLRALEEAISAAQINLHLFTVDDVQRSWGFDTVAGNTGGGSSLLTWSNSGALEQAIRATSRYYRATFKGDDPPAGRPQRVELRVNRPDHKVRTASSIR